MRQISALAVVVFALAGCADGSDDNSSSSSSQSCSTHWECVNDACACTSGPNDGNSCEHPDDSSGSDNCDDYCEVCE